MCPGYNQLGRRRESLRPQEVKRDDWGEGKKLGTSQGFGIGPGNTPMDTDNFEPLTDDVLVGSLNLVRANDLQAFAFEAGIVGVVEL